MKRLRCIKCTLFIPTLTGSLLFSLCSSSWAALPTLELSLKSAEDRAVKTSHRLKSASADHEAALSQASSQFSLLLPRLSLQGSYQYFAQIPDIHFGPTVLPFGINNVFSVGPAVTYTLWDTFSNLNSYQSANKSADVKKEDYKNNLLQLLLMARSSYIQVELAIEELILINDSLSLSKAQYKDVENRFNAGAAAELDLLTANRSVLNYELQFKQRQADLTVSLKDLLALVEERNPEGISNPGPSEIPGVQLVLKFDSFSTLLQQEKDSNIPAPDDTQPQLRGSALAVESLQHQISSQEAKLWPLLQVSGSVNFNQPNMPTSSGASPLQFWQESVAATLMLPLFLGDPTRQQAAALRSQAVSAEERLNQLKIDVHTNFEKASELLKSLKDRRKLAEKDLQQSERIAKLYYTAYKAGKLNILDVQTANFQALEAKVNATRIDAQILTQIMQLKAISGKELPNG